MSTDTSSVLGMSPSALDSLVEAMETASSVISTIVSDALDGVVDACSGGSPAGEAAYAQTNSQANIRASLEGLIGALDQIKSAAAGMRSDAIVHESSNELLLEAGVLHMGTPPTA